MQQSALRGQVVTDAVPADDGSDKSFVVGINKNELGKRWFMSAYLKQFFPDSVTAGAARTLGTRVVTFRIQNDKLFVFDASDTHKESDVFDPTLVIEAYPLVHDSGIGHRRGADRFVFFDPASGISHFSLINDAFFATPPPIRFDVEVSFLQNFRSLADGAVFEQVFTGQASAAIHDATGGEDNALRASGTLGLSLRRYAEGSHFQVVPPPPTVFYFLSPPRVVPNVGVSVQSVDHFDIFKGMKPIEWIISDEVIKLKNDPVWGPLYQKYDVAGALLRAVNDWNAVFGFPALTARIATAADSFGDDDKNVVIWDPNPVRGFAFANWRTNPNNGETRGASVYYSSAFLVGADQEFPDDPKAAINPAAAVAHPSTWSLQWDAIPEERLCTMWASDGAQAAGADVSANAIPATKKAKVEALLEHVLVHEIGHTLGLRHNFKGSTVPVSSSVMDYLFDNDRIQVAQPQPFDFDAVRFLYGLSPNLPTQPFCNDDNVASDPDCKRFDRGVDPFRQFWAPNYVRFVPAFLATAPADPAGLLPTVDLLLNSVLDSVRVGPPARDANRPLTAWNAAIGITGVPFGGPAALAPAADLFTARIFTRLFQDAAATQGDIGGGPAPDIASPANAAANHAIVAQLGAVLANQDHIRSFASRRQTVDILKQVQRQDAYDALVAGHDAVTTELRSLAGDAQLQAQDLLVRIDNATHPYYK